MDRKARIHEFRANITVFFCSLVSMFTGVTLQSHRGNGDANDETS